jgi:hypothetical protein
MCANFGFGALGVAKSEPKALLSPPGDRAMLPQSTGRLPRAMVR